MKRLNILVLTLQARGHIYPVLPLCHELTKRGHRVVYATNKDYVDAAESSGSQPLIFENAPVGSKFEDWWNRTARLPFDRPEWFSPPDEWIDTLRIDVACLQSRIDEFLNAGCPDVVLYDQYFYPGVVVSHRLSCPRVRISAHFANYKNFLARINGICMSSPVIVDLAARLSNFFAQEGIDTNGNIWPIEDLNIHFIPDAFQYHRAYFDDRFVFTGHSMDRHFARKWIDNGTGDPIILLSGFSGIGGVRHDLPVYVDSFIDALANSECRCVLLSQPEQVYSAPLPDNFEICPGVSPLEVLPHARLFVCHGGMGSTLEALYNGVPVLTIPSQPSTDEIAYRVEELDIGLRIAKEDVTTQRVQEAVAALLWRKQFRERVQEMRTMFECSVGATGASDKIEQFVEEH